ncbi:hypothetical protein ACRCUN_23555 [Mycobacterium sp. LTG2003]
MAEEADSVPNQRLWDPSVPSEEVTKVFVRAGVDRGEGLPGPPPNGLRNAQAPQRSGMAMPPWAPQQHHPLPPPPDLAEQPHEQSSPGFGGSVRTKDAAPRRPHAGSGHTGPMAMPTRRGPAPTPGPRAEAIPQTDAEYRRSAPIQAATAGLHAELVTVSQEEQSPRATTGWRGTLNGLGLGLGPSAKERRHRDLVQRIRAPKNAMYAVAVLTLKGGAGKTTVSSTLGQVFASLRPDGVLAVDVDPAAGDLDTRTAIHPERHTMLDLLNASDLSQRDFVQRYLSTTETNLHVLAGGWRADSDRVLVPEDIRDVHEIASHYYSLLLWDGGTDLHTPVSREVLTKSDALVLLIPPTRSGALAAAKSIDWLRFHGHEGLLARTVLLINESSAKPQMSVDELRKFFARQQIKMHYVGYDKHLDEGLAVDLNKLSRRSRRGFEELAGVLADDFLIPQPPAQSAAGD